MELSTYHSHCHYCDGEDTPESFIREAIQRGLSSFGFSCHAPLPFPNDWSMKKRDVQSYISDVKLLKSGYHKLIDIYLGIEADFIPGKSLPQKIKHEYDLDYVIGSVHYVKQFNSGVPFQIDGSPEDFERGFNEIFNRNSRSLITEYYSLIRKMVETSPPDIIGHLDKIVMHCTSHQVFDASDIWYVREIMDTLEVIKSTGCLVEVNTRSMYKRKMPDPYPMRWILEKLHEMNIPVVLNSDAHRPNEIIGAYDRAITLMKDAGFQSTMVLENNQWTEKALTEKAIQ